MPHVVDLDEEKQPFLSDSDGVTGDLNNLTGNGNIGNGHGHSHLSNYLQNNLNHHTLSINHHDKSCDSNANGSYTGSSSSNSSKLERDARSAYIMKIVTALFYAVASFLITVVNKIVLTSYK